MSNIRRMLMMLANDLPKRESISYHKRYISTDIEWGNYFIVNPTNINSRTNSSSTFGSCMEVSKGDVVVLNTATYSALIGYALFDADGNYANIQEYGNGNLYVLYNIDVNNNGYIGFNCKSARYSDFYLDLTRTLSQEAYDYALSFGKKCVKDLKKAIEESDNPAMLIKRINDWKYVIHSLVDTGYTSWLKGDGSAYIDMGVFGSGDTITEVVVRNNRTTADSSITCGVLGAMSSYTSRNYTLFYSSDSGMYIFNGYNTTYPKISPKGAYCNGVLKKDKGDLYYNGGLINSIDYASFTTQYAMYLFAFNRQGSATGLSNNIYISRCDINGSNIFVPYYNGSEYCMLDINSGVIYENANVVDGEKVGAFGFVVTDADGDEYEDFCDIEGNRIVTTLNDGEVLCLHQHIPAYYIGENKTTIYREPNTSYEFTDDGLLVYGSDVNIGFAPTNSVLFIDGHKYLNIYRMQGVIDQLRFNDGSKRYITISSVNNNEITTKSNIFIKTETTSRKVYQISWNATENSTTWVYAQAIDLTLLFGEANVPTTAEEVYNIIHTENMNDLWYIPPTSTPIPLIVVCGSLHYALNKSVRDYAEEKGKLNELNTYCCENKDAIAIFNADKTKVDTLLE